MKRLVLPTLIALCISFADPCCAQDPKAAHTAGSMAGAKLFSRAADLQNKEDWDTAISTWRSFLRKYPKDPLVRQAHNYLGVCLLQQESFQTAAAEFEKVLDKERADEIAEEAHLNLAWCYYSQGFNNDAKKLRKAAHIFKSHTTRFPKSEMKDQALYYLAESLIMTDLPKQAIEAYRELIKTSPDSPLRADAIYALGNVLSDRKETEESQDAFDMLVKEYPNHPMAAEAKLRHAESLMAGGDWDAAASAFAAIAKVRSEGSDYIALRLGLCLERMERFSDAAAIYAAAATQFKKSEFAQDLTLSAARSYALAHQTEDAEAWLKLVKAEDDDSAMEFAHWTCRLHLWKGEPQSAEKMATAALRDYPNGAFRTEVALDQAEAMSLTPSSRKLAASKYMALAESLPEGELQWRAALGAADCLLQLKRTDEATEIAQTFLDAHKEHEHRPSFQFVFAESFRIEGDHDRAQAILELLIKDNEEHPLMPIWQRRLARVLLHQEQYEESLAVLDKIDVDAISEEEQSEAHFFRAIALDKMSKKEEAIEAYQTAYETYPEGKWGDKCLLAIAELQNEMGNSADAESTIKLAQSRPMEHDSDQQAKLQLAEAALNAGDHKKATEIFTELTEGQEDNAALRPHALFGRAYSQLYQRDYDRSGELFSQFLGDYPDHALAAHARYGRAMTSGYQTLYQVGIDDLDAILALTPGIKFEANARYLKGLYHHNLSEFGLATESFAALLDSTPDYERKETVLYQLAFAAAKSNDMVAAEKWISQLSREYPKSSLAADASAQAGEQCFADQQYAMAESFYQDSLLQNPKPALRQSALYRLGWSQYEQRKFEEAMDCFESTVESTGESEISGQRLIDVRFMQAQCLFEMEQYAKAAEYYEVVNISDENDSAPRAVALHRGAICLQADNQWRKSIERLESLITMNPSEPQRSQAQILMGKAQLKTGAVSLAKQYFEKVAANADSETKAEAHVRLGRLLVAEEENFKALRQFQEVMFGFEGESNEKIRNWKALGAIEAGRCSLRLAKLASDTSEKTEHRKRAEEYFRLVLRDHSDLNVAKFATKLLKSMKRR